MTLISSAKTENFVANDDEELAAFAAELMGRAIADAVSARGVARVALSGGSTPGPAYRKLATFALPWDRVEWFWVDERAVPPDHERSNFRQAQADLGLDKAPLNQGRVYRMEGEASDLAKAAGDYQGLLRERFGIAGAVAFDVMTLGIGDDGHTASLFPGMGTVNVTDRLVLAVPAQPEKGLEARLTLSAPVICEARVAVVLVKGAKKRPMILDALAQGPLDSIPSRVFTKIKGDLYWVVDKAAAP